VVGRLISPKMSEVLGQQVLVDNRAGAGGSIGADIVAKAAPDGYTILVATGSTHTMNPVLYKKIPYHPIRDFAPIGMVVVTPFILVTHKDTPATDLKSFVELVKKNPGKYNYGSSGVGSNLHLCTEQLKQLTGMTDLTHVPYRGSGPLLNDLTSGQLGLALDAIATSTPHIQAGTFRPLGAATIKRLRTMPDLPTLDEQGAKGFDCYTWNGLYAPAKTPEPIIKRLNEALNAVLADKAITGRMMDMGFDPMTSSTPRQLADFTQSELDRWTPIIKATGVELD
jgi:tripartite-type tricarboxylate transporter receptor subunit TctC